MSEYELSPWLYGQLLAHFATEIGDGALRRLLVCETLKRLRALRTAYATDSDVLPWALDIARDLLLELQRSTDSCVEESSKADWICEYEELREAREAEVLATKWLTQQPAGLKLGPNHPVLRKLYAALEKLATLCDGIFAFVIDAGGVPWCIAPARSQSAALAPPLLGVLLGASPASLHVAMEFHRRELVPRLAQLRRGQRMYITNAEGAGRYAAMSFAGIYVVVVWFDDEFDLSYVRPKIQRMLPEIQSLTLALPPWPGPGCDEGARRARA